MAGAAAFLATSLVLAHSVLSVLAWGKEVDSEIMKISWSQWISNLVYKGIYFVLICLITICIAITSFKNKYGDADDEERDVVGDQKTGWMDTLWKAASGGNNPAFLTTTASNDSKIKKLLYLKGDIQEDGGGKLRDQLIDAQNTVNVLKEELQQSNKARLDLEETLEALDREKATAEELLDSHKYQGVIEVEQLKRDYERTHRQLQKTLCEKDQLDQEVASLQRDARIVSSALRDNKLMDARLEEARKEIAQLKEQLGSIQAEKERATELVERIIASKKAQPDHSPSLAGDVPSVSLPYIDVTDNDTDHTQPSSLCGSEDGEKSGRSKYLVIDDTPQGRQPTSGPFDQTEHEYYVMGEDGELFESVLCQDQVDPGLVTGSEAFQRFLQKNFLPQ